jgi:hypothetical protein
VIYGSTQAKKTEYIVLMAKDELLKFPKPITKNIGNSFGVTSFI